MHIQRRQHRQRVRRLPDRQRTQAQRLLVFRNELDSVEGAATVERGACRDHPVGVDP